MGNGRYGKGAAAVCAAVIISACSPPAPTSRPTRPSGPAAQAGQPPKHKPPKKHRAVISDTYIVAPRQVGRLHLVLLHNYQSDANAAHLPIEDALAHPTPAQLALARKAALMEGVQMRYAERSDPRVFADVYVYPAGGGPAQPLLTAELRRFRHGMQAAIGGPMYDSVRFGRVRHRDLRAGAGLWHGVMLPMTITRHGKRQSYASRTYLFVHHLYYYKLRIDAPAGAPKRFDARAQRFLHKIVAATETVSTGSCGYRMQLVVLKPGDQPPDDFSDGVNADGTAMLAREQEMRRNPDAAARTIAAELALSERRQADHGCVAIEQWKAPKSTQDHVVAHLHYPPGAFHSSHTRSNAPH